MNQPIRTLAMGCLVMLTAILLNLNYIQVLRASDLNSDSANARARDAECARERGPILVSGDAVARSVPSHDSLKYVRKYTQPLLYAPVTGFFSCVYGSGGMENSENSVLSGTDQRLLVNNLVSLVGNDQPKGGSVLLTINPAVQKAAYNGLRALPGRTKGAAVALNPKTGAILAMVSTPSYNPNLIGTHNASASRRAWKRLTSDPAQPMLNRATQEIYPPGSTFKLVVSAAALQHGFNPDTLVRGGYSLNLPLTTTDMHNENGGNCGGDPITLTQALVVSCNVSFASIGLHLKAPRLRHQADAFGFNDDYLDQLPLAPSRFPAHLNAPQTALSSIGQYEVAATPLQMAMVAAGVANGGAVMRPYVVQEVRSPDLNVIDRAQPQLLHQAMPVSAARELTSMMVAVVQSGTGTPAQIQGVSVAGKTGTANTSTGRAPYAWMLAFAPADNPQIAVAVLVEQTGVSRSEITGGGLAGPIAKAMMQAVIH